MPKPSSGETRKAFIDRCMADPKARADYPENDQRFAVCTSFWEDRGNAEDKKMKNQVRVNVTTKVNRDKIRREKVNGRDSIIVPSATLPDNVIMNNIMYPADEIAGSYETLENTPAPFGHPEDESGNFLSAATGPGMNGFYIGAYNVNVRREGGRVLLDKVIDVETAEALPNGQRVLNAIEKGEPIHTSTGLLCEIEEAGDNADCEYIARNMLFDHDAILLDEPGAATPDQGVGMLVNKAKDGEIPVINSTIDEDFDYMVEAAAESVAYALERKKQRESASLIVERIKSALKGIFDPEREEPETNSDEVDMTDVKKADVDALSAKVDALANAFEKLDIKGAVEAIVAPLTEKVDVVVNAAQAKEKAEHGKLVEQVVNANLLDKDTAEKSPAATLQALVKNSSGGTAAPIFNGHMNSAGQTKIELPED